MRGLLVVGMWAVTFGGAAIIFLILELISSIYHRTWAYDHFFVIYSILVTFMVAFTANMMITSIKWTWDYFKEKKDNEDIE